MNKPKYNVGDVVWIHFYGVTAEVYISGTLEEDMNVYVVDSEDGLVRRGLCREKDFFHSFEEAKAALENK